MLDILKFIFQDFRHWLGFAVLLSIAVHGLGHIFSVNVRTKKVYMDDISDDLDKK